MSDVRYLLFCLLILLIPTQLTRHFFFDFSLISGLRSDYLAPTIYLTDIIITILIGLYILRAIRQLAESREVLIDSSRQARTIRDYINTPNRIYLISFIFYLLFSSIFIAVNKWVALYKFIKILEFIFLGFVIYKLKPKTAKTISFLSLGVFYSSVIAIWQFMIQKSIDGLFLFLGERTFSAATPGIAAMAGPTGVLLLRPYATFPHPNVFGGFLAVTLPLILFYSSSDPGVTPGESRNSRQARTIKRLWLAVVFALGIAALILTFSRVAWVVAFIGFMMVFLERKMNLMKKVKNKINVLWPTLLTAILFSVLIPLFLPDTFFPSHDYWQERVSLIKTATPMILSNMVFGVGLNNSIIQLKNYVDFFPGLYIFQPIHNIYLLYLAETGLFGLIFFLFGFWKFLGKALKSRTIFLIPIVQLFLLGLFDHYLFTLQQGQLILTIFLSLAII